MWRISDMWRILDFLLKKSMKHFGISIAHCNVFIYISSVNTKASGDSPLAKLIEGLDSCLFLGVISQNTGIESQQSQSIISPLQYNIMLQRLE